MSYQICEYIYDRLSEDDFRSEETLKEAISAIDDPKGTIGDGSKWLNEVPNPGGNASKYYKPKITQSLKSFMEEAQKEYIATKEKEINAAATSKDTKDIKIDDKYEPDTVSLIQSKINEKLTTFVEEVRDELDKAFDKEDIPGMKEVAAISPEQEELKQNELYNLTRQLEIKANRGKDISALRELRGTVSGLRDEAELRDILDDDIARIERQNKEAQERAERRAAKQKTI